MAARFALSGDRTTWEWGCSKCKGEDYEAGDRLREARNCDGETNIGFGLLWFPSLKRCPWSEITAEAWEVLRWAIDYERFGILPWGGTDIMAQPAFVFEVIELYQTVKSDLEAKEAYKQKQELEAQQRKAKAKHGR